MRRTHFSAILRNRSHNLGQKTKPRNCRPPPKEELHNCRHGCPGRPHHKLKLKESEKKDKYLDLARELKPMEHESDSDTKCNWGSWYNPERIGTRTRGILNKRTRRGHPIYCIVKILQNTEKCPENLRRLVVTQTPVRNHLQTLV